MKKILVLLFIIIIFQSNSNSQCPQVSAQVLTTNHGQINEVGAYNSFGVRITLNQVYSEDVTVTGVIFDSENHNVSANFEITVTAGYLTQEAGDLLNSGRESYAATEVNTVSPCFVTYAGVTIVFDVTNGILKFASISDAYTVLEQLDDDYESNYDTYDSQFDTSLSVSVLDSLDEVNGFDPRITFKNFENLFSGYNSMRMAIESTEIAWLDNDFSGTDPSDIDLTVDDAVNTICNSNYSFKVGNDVYVLTSSGLYINNTLQDYEGSIAKNSSDFLEKYTIVKPISYLGMNDVNSFDITSNQFYQNPYSEISNNLSNLSCKTNKKRKESAYFSNDTERYDLEVAIHSIGYRSGVHGKVVHFKLKNGNWKRSRAKMKAGVGGGVNSNSSNCNGLANINEVKPYSGYDKREELKAMRHSTYGDIHKVWTTYTNQLAASFTTPYSGQSGVLVLTF